MRTLEMVNATSENEELSVQWEILMDRERFDMHTKTEDQRAVALGSEPNELSNVSTFCGLGLGDALQLPKEDTAGAEHQTRMQFERCAAEPLTTITAILPKSKWNCLLSRIVRQDALSEITKIHPSLKLRVFGG